MGAFTGKTMIVSGGSRGIGLAIALKVAADGANVALLAKTAEPHPKLEGTIFTAAEQIEAAGGQGAADRRRTSATTRWWGRRWRRRWRPFGGIDIVLNNASAIDLSRTARHQDEALRPDAGHQLPRHLPAAPKTCIPHLREADERRTS